MVPDSNRWTTVDSIPLHFDRAIVHNASSPHVLNARLLRAHMQREGSSTQQIFQDNSNITSPIPKSGMSDPIIPAHAGLAGTAAVIDPFPNEHILGMRSLGRAFGSVSPSRDIIGLHSPSPEDPWRVDRI